MTTDRTENDWRHRAACRDEEPELFQPVGNTGAALLQIEEAKAVCRRCTVREQCLQWALDRNEPSGVWGGLSEEERYSLKRRASRERSQQKKVRIYPQDRKILAAHADGKQPEEIAHTLHVTRDTVLRSLRQLRAAGLITTDVQYAEAA